MSAPEGELADAIPHLLARALVLRQARKHVLHVVHRHGPLPVTYTSVNDIQIPAPSKTYPLLKTPFSFRNALKSTMSFSIASRI